MINLADVILRLGGATLIGAAIGLNRDLRGKPIGVRTLGLVGLASAMAVLVVAPAGGDDISAASRVMQGVLTGIGFLGAGVIVRGNIGKEVHGLTSAACAWTTACLGMICGLAAWPIVATGIVLVFILLILGGPFERMSHRWFGAFLDRAEEGGRAASGEESPERTDSRP